MLGVWQTIIDEALVKFSGFSVIVSCTAALSMLCCTWVPLTAEGQDVRVLRASETTECEKVGAISTKTADRVTVFARSDRKVREELENLARNDAREMGGDAIAPSSAVSGGRQSFDVYRCQPR